MADPRLEAASSLADTVRSFLATCIDCQAKPAEHTVDTPHIEICGGCLTKHDRSRRSVWDHPQQEMVRALAKFDESCVEGAREELEEETRC